MTGRMLMRRMAVRILTSSMIWSTIRRIQIRVPCEEYEYV
jgi:hypothetical protein